MQGMAYSDPRLGNWGPTCYRITKPTHDNYWARVPWSPCSATGKRPRRHNEDPTQLKTKDLILLKILPLQRSSTSSSLRTPSDSMESSASPACSAVSAQPVPHVGDAKAGHHSNGSQHSPSRGTAALVSHPLIMPTHLPRGSNCPFTNSTWKACTLPNCQRVSNFSLLPHWQVTSGISLCCDLIINEVGHLFWVFNGNLSVCLSAALPSPLPISDSFIELSEFLQILKKISLLSNMLASIDLIAITKWHNLIWEFKLFFYIYRKYSISIFYMHITKGNSNINKSPSLVVCYSLLQIPPDSKR